VLSENRVYDGSFPIPKRMINKMTVAVLWGGKVFYGQFTDCFSREESREDFSRLLLGTYGNGASC